MNKQELAAMVAEILGSVAEEPAVKGSDYRPTDPGPQPKATGFQDGDFVPDVTALDLRKLYLTEAPENREKFARMKEKTPARLGSGRAGPRYKTLLEGAKGSLTAAELEYLPWGARLMTLECGIRFLTDYLDGDNYFRIHYADQNLDRCRTQFKLVSDMEAQFAEMAAVVAKYAK